MCATLCCVLISQIAKFMGLTWSPPGSCRPQMGPMLAPWTLLSGMLIVLWVFFGLSIREHMMISWYEYTFHYCHCVGGIQSLLLNSLPRGTVIWSFDDYLFLSWIICWTNSRFAVIWGVMALLGRQYYSWLVWFNMVVISMQKWWIHIERDALSFVISIKLHVTDVDDLAPRDTDYL